MKVGGKIGGGYALAAIILVIIGGIAYTTITNLISCMREVDNSHEMLSTLHDVHATFFEMNLHGRQFLLTGEEGHLHTIMRTRTELDQKLAQVRKMTNSPVILDKLSTLAALLTEVSKELETTIDRRRQKGLEAAMQAMRLTQSQKVLEEVARLHDGIEAEEMKFLQEKEGESSQRAAMASHTIIFGIPATIILLGVVGLLNTRHIARPLEAMSQAAARLATGDVSLDFSAYQRQDEVGQLAQNFDRMIHYQKEMAEIAHQISQGNLATTLKPRSEKDLLGQSMATMIANTRQHLEGITAGIGALTSAASEIMATATQIASGATETASAVSETTATIEELRQTIHLSSQKAREVSEYANQTAAVSLDGKKAVETTINGMNRIRQQMDSIAESIVKLSEQNQAIGAIITAVNDMADQSNLLAVNASIEAAKAGEQGKGFAVVAQEVRNLAEQSKQATAQVRLILNDIQKAITTAVMATEQGGKVVEVGVNQSNEAGNSISQLAEAVSSSAQASVQIVAATNEQLIGMDQVAQAMESIKQASDQNVKGIRQVETAIHELNGLGRNLQEMIEHYRI
ncbi:MAG: HAMP domain-containing methyl-accepting chemotaxis protein [Desulfobacca sp.]|uniref:HAMP domain-containing methyl-accepting chemotaxis protein n=1 Tax=Desulfobacca sp. TaxID=2067990 RepID=UPI00404A4450